MIARVRGTEDVLDLRLYNFMLEKIKHHLALYNFNHIETPILEHTELFIRSVGQETDIVSKEMYVFNTEGGESICLRPEGTASIIRSYVENGINQSPWKVYLHGPMFRHERPQKGRWRQFNQISIEVINTAAIEQDAHLLSMLDRLFSDVLKIEHYTLKINFLGCLEDRKNHKAALFSFLTENADHICQTCTTRKDKNTLRVFDCKNESCQALYQKAPHVTDFLCQSCSPEWDTLKKLLEALCVNYIIDPMLVRGLDYYYNTVFEFSSRNLGAQSAFCGGGRYSLGKDVGAKENLMSVGVGLGMGRLYLLLEQNANKLSLPEAPALHVIIPFTQEQNRLALMIAAHLQKNNLATEVILDNASISNKMKKANRIGAKHVLIIGTDEQAQGTVSIKNMLKGTSETVKQSDVINYLKGQP